MQNENESRRQIDAIGNQFKKNCLSDKRPSIGSFLDQVGPRHRDQLLRALLEIEVELRIEACLPVDPNEYRELGDGAVVIVEGLIKGQKLEQPVSNGGVATTAVIPNSVAQSSHQIGPYKLLQKIGEGGMGTVWMAEQEKPVRRRVAIKLIKAGVDNKQVIARFEAERQALAMMDHQNIAKVLDAGATEDGRPYFVMELVQGIPLTKYCDSQKLSIAERLELFIPVCNAVQHAHQKGVIHRDLKPSNVLVTLYDGKPVPKIIDFGLAKALQHQTKLTDKTMFTEFGQVVGTLQYMSPEQAEMNALDVDTRTDIYSLGVLLYELLTGSTPLDKESMEKQAIFKVLEQIREQDPPRPSVRLSSISQEASSGISEQRRIEPAKLKSILRGELDWIVMKALEKNRTRRYETATGFAEDITRYLTGDPVQARPPSTGYRLRKYFHKHKGLVASLALIASLLFAGIIGISWFAWAANRARERADAKTLEVAKEKTNVERERDRANTNEELAKAEAERAAMAADEAQASEEKAQSALAQSEATLARSNYFLANARWNEHRASEARKLLQGIPEKYRNLEWYLDNRTFQGGHLTLYGHQAAVTCVAFSPEGTSLVSGSEDRTVRVWSAVTGQEIRLLKGHQKGVTGLAISPTGDRIVSGSRDNTLKIWDAQSGHELITLRGHTNVVSSVAFSADGHQIVSGSNDATIRIWDASTGVEQHKLTGHADVVTSVTFSPDGTRIVSGSLDKTVKVWDSKSASEVSTLKGHTAGVTSVVFSPDGSRIASGSWDKSVTIWDVASFKPLNIFTEHYAVVSAAAFTPDGMGIVSGGHLWLKHWDTGTRQLLRTFIGHTGAITSVAVSPDGARVASASVDTTVKIWDSAARATRGLTRVDVWDAPNCHEMKTLRGHSHWVQCVAVSPDGKRIVSGSADKTLKVWDVDSGEELCTLVGHTGIVQCAAFSPDGKRMVSGSADKSLRLWDVESGTEIQTLTGHSNWVDCITFSPDGARIVSGSWDNSLKVWDATTGIELQALDGHSNQIWCLAFSPDGTMIVSGGTDKTLKIWNAASGNELRTLIGHESSITGVAFTPNSHQIMSECVDGTLNVWDAGSGELLHSLHANPEVVTNMALSPDGTRIVLVGDVIKLWDADTMQELRVLVGHPNWVKCVAFAPSGKWFVTGGEDNTLKVWDTSRNDEIFTMTGHRFTVKSATFNPDGTRIISEDIQGNKLAWNCETGLKIYIDSWPDSKNLSPLSPDGRWLLVPMGGDICLIDLEFKNTPDEKAYRAFKARLDAKWHQEQAVASEQYREWYAAIFHWAWVMKADPEQAFACDSLHSAYEELKSEYVAKQNGLAPNLHPIVTEMLNLPRGNKLLSWSVDDAKRVNDETWKKVNKAPAKNTESPVLSPTDLNAIREIVSQYPRGIYFNTLGTAEYRMGNFQAAIEAFNKSVELTSKEPDLPGPHPGDLAILAMSHFKLGNRDEANKFREQFIEAMKQEEFKDDEECLSFAKEVEELFAAEGNSDKEQ